MRWGRCALVTFFGLFAAGIAGAANFSFTGAFTTDDQLQVFLFSAPTVNTLIRTWGYAGGTNAAGDLVPVGGLDPFLSVFDLNATGGALTPASLLVASNDNGPQCPTNAPNCVSADPASGNADDSLLQLSALTPGGVYALVLTEAGNVPNGLTFGAGFSEAGQGNFTVNNGCFNNLPFCAGFFDQRDGNWAVDITGVGAASQAGVPEPVSVWSLTSGLAVLALWRRRKQS